jgi:hypothetical protein
MMPIPSPNCSNTLVYCSSTLTTKYALHRLHVVLHPMHSLFLYYRAAHVVLHTPYTLRLEEYHSQLGLYGHTYSSSCCMQVGEVNVGLHSVLPAGAALLPQPATTWLAANRMQLNQPQTS